MAAENHSPDLSTHNEDYAFEYLYPFPIADLYRRYLVAREPADRLGYLLSAGEASLKLVVAAAAAVSVPSTDLQQRLGSGQNFKAPTFGTWRHLLSAFLGAQSLDCPLAHDLQKHVLGSSTDSDSYLISIRALIELRNAYVHERPITNEAAEDYLLEAGTLLRRCFRHLLFFVRYSFAITEEVRKLRTPNCFEVVIRRCVGSNPLFGFETWRLREAVDPEIGLLLAHDASQAYRLDPILAIFRGDRQKQLKCWFYMSTRSGAAVWHSYESLDMLQREGSEELSLDLRQVLSGRRRDGALGLAFYDGRAPSWVRTLTRTPGPQPAGYSSLGEIGHGRYATVYKVMHTGLRELRALKVLHRHGATDSYVRKRFEIEAQMLARLRGSAAAIEIFEYGDLDDGTPFLIVEYLSEGSLEEMLGRWGAKQASDVMELAAGCLRSLKAIHDAGILHRDIKLSNILVRDDSYVFCDFGVARTEQEWDPLTMAGDSIGTFGYAAPEQLMGESSRQSDIFSLGVCLTNLLAGEVLTNARRWLRDHAVEIPELGLLLLNMTEELPENRPPSAGAVIARLSAIRDRWQKGLTIPAGVSENSLQPIRAENAANHTTGTWKAPDGTIFRVLPAGEFVMGGTKYADERPVHAVRFDRSFMMASTAVTNRQFREFCEETNYRGRHSNFLLHLREGALPTTWRAAENPVAFVSWRDAKEYVLWRCERDDLDYRLPTEAQWEYACRCGSRTVYPWGNTYDKRRLNADNTHGHPTPVGSYPPNDWGLFDMLGNLWEWCEDAKDVVPREESLFYRMCAERALPCVDPCNSGPASVISRRIGQGLRVVRGGSFFSEGRNFRPANRRGQAETDAVRSVGFRLTCHSVINV